MNKSNALVHRSINNYDADSKFKIPKPLTVIIFYMQMICGIDIGFGEYFEGYVRVVVKTVTLLVGMAVTLNLAYPWFGFNTWYWCCLIKCLMTVIHFAMTKYKVIHFLNDIQTIRTKYPNMINDLFGIAIFIFNYGICFTKSLLSIVNWCESSERTCSNFREVLTIIMFISSLNYDSIGFLTTIIIYYVYCVVFHMRKCLFSTMSLKEFEDRYVTLADCFQKIKWLFNRLILIELFINTPRLMITLWYMLLYIKENAEWYSYTSEWLFAFHLTIQMCIPAVIAEMVNVQMDSIKLILNEQRRIEKDKQKSEELTRVIRYIKARHLQSDIWRVIPVDLRLPLGLFSICTTYFIVILQFTHLYD